MRAEDYILANDNARNNAIMRIREMPCDGKTKITISNSGNKSSLQRGLNWRWNTDVANSGMGGSHEDTKEGVHIVSKYRWAIPILVRDDEFFADLYKSYFNKHGKDPERMMWFVDTQVHTEKMSVSQVAEYLTDFERYYLSKGVPLTNPDDRGLLAI